MEMNFENAFTFLAQDPKYKGKLFVGSILSLLWFILLFLPLIPLSLGGLKAGAIAFLVFYCLDFLVFVYLVGYTYLVANNRVHNSEEILPCWCEFRRILSTGVKSFVGYSIFSVPILIMIAVIFVIFLLFAFVPSDMLSFIFSFFLLVLVCCVLVLGVFYTLCCYLMMASFAEDLKILSFIDFKKAYSMINGNWVNYLILLLLIFAVGVILQILACVLICTIIGIIFIPSLCFYSGLVTMDLIAQFVKTKAGSEI